jgi:glutamate synthase (NADPH) large chain
MVELERVVAEEDEIALRNLLEEHRRLTGSVNAARVLDNWSAMLPKFIKVMPRDYKRVLAERKKRQEDAALGSVAG